jgi:DNA-binding CsgD family transcriptional regulator
MQCDSELLLSLYREARVRSTAEFQAFGIQLVRPILEFDSAVWGSGYFDSRERDAALIPIGSVSHEIDPAGFAYWKSINRADKVIPVVRDRPFRTFNFHAPTIFASKDDEVMRDYAQRFGRQSYLCTALASIETPLFEWFSAYRPDPDRPFREEERKRGELLIMHLHEALRINHLVQGWDPPLPGEEPGVAYAALIDKRGVILAANAKFNELCRKQWREFGGTRLPDVVMRQFASPNPSFNGRHVVLHARGLAEFTWVTATAVVAQTGLSPRLTDVASLYGAGLSYKEIASYVGRSPATIRNQIASTFRELGVNSRGELRKRLAAASQK